MPKGYVLVLVDVLDQHKYAEYAAAATAIEIKYGGRPLVAGDVEQVLEGEWPSNRVVVLEFPSIEVARAGTPIRTMNLLSLLAKKRPYPVL